MMVPAHLVVAGVGLPPVYLLKTNKGASLWGMEPDDETGEDLMVDLPDFQTQQGCLRQLAIYSGDEGNAQAYWLAPFSAGWRLIAYRREKTYMETFMWATVSLDAFYWVRGNVKGRVVVSRDKPRANDAVEALGVILEHIGKVALCDPTLEEE